MGSVQVSDCIGLQSLILQAQTGVSARALDREGRIDFVLVIMLLSFEKDWNGIKRVDGRKVVQDGMDLGECSPWE